jgi:uncharacterized protein YjiS (DUF1127 family)
MGNPPRCAAPIFKDRTMSNLKPLAALRRWMRYRNNLKVLARLDRRTIGLNRAGMAYAR